MSSSIYKLYIASFTSQYSPGIHAKYLGIMNAALRKGISCSLYEHERGNWLSYFKLAIKLISADEELFWIRYNLEKSPMILLYSLILKARRKKLIIEIPTAFSSHIKTSKSPFHNIFYYCFSPLIIKLASKVNIYSKEKGYLSRYSQNMNLIGNGIDFQRVRLKSTSNSVKDGINIVVAATLASWHGVDILIRALSLVKKDVVFKLHIVGDGPEYEALVQLTQNLELMSSVIFYGMVDLKLLNKIYDQCNLAAGSLNWAKIGITESSPIKNREYSLAGLPFFYVGYDVDFSGSDVAFQLKGADTLCEIVSLIEKIYREDSLPEPAFCRKFAELYLTYDSKIGGYIA